jgi:plasmid stabilization system protein ParE
MAKKYKLSWSAESDRRVAEIIVYTRKEWTEKEVGNFLDQLKKFETIVLRFPRIYPESQIKKGYRKAIISKQNSIIYKVDKNVIRILTVFDNRQDPGRLK